MGRLALHSYWFFLREVLQYQWMDPWLHGEELCRFIEEDPDVPKIVLVPRGHGKTGMVTVPYPVWRLTQDPLGSICVCNAAEDRATKMISASAGIITNNERFKKCFPYMVPSKKWGESGYVLDARSKAEGSADRVDPSMISYGIGGNVTGSHISTAFILDDVISREIAKSPVRLADAKAFFEEVCNCVDPGVGLLLCGTRWHYLDFYGEIERGELTAKNGPLRVLRLGCFKEDGSPLWPRKTYSYDRKLRDGTVVTVEKQVGFTPEELENLKKKKLFSALYLNEPVLSEDQQFQTDRLNVFPSIEDLPFQLGGVARAVFETESQAHAAYSAIKFIARQEGRRIILDKIDSMEDGKRIKKEDRILSYLQAPIAEGTVWIHRDIYRGTENLGEEMRTYPKGHDDVLDASAWAIKIARDTPEGACPKVYIAVDPAFTEAAHSDYSAMVAVCKYRGNIYLLDARRLQTQHTDVLAREFFRFYDKFNQFSETKKEKSRYMGFNSVSYHSGGRRPRKEPRLEMDDSHLIGNKYGK